MSETQSIKQNAIQSAKWAFIARSSQVLGGAFVFIFLPFWLTPDDFGIISIFSSVLALAMIFQQFGLMEATVQRQQESIQVRDAAFWLNIFISICLYFIIFFLSPFISRFFSDLRLTTALRVVSIQIILSGFTNISLAWLQREFRFRSYALIQFASSVLMIMTSLVFALRGAGYWAYILGILSGATVKLLFSLFIMDWKPRYFLFDRFFGESLKFGIFVVFEMVLGWFLVWFDNIVVAKNIGSDAAGVYSLTFNIANMAISLPISAITGVTLPTFSRLQNDIDALRAAYLKGTELIAAYSIPAGIGLCILGPVLTKVIYPGHWDAIGSILPILALYAGFGHLWILNTDVFKAIGKPDTMFRIYVPVVFVMIPVYWFSSLFGLVEFSIARSFVVLIGALPHSYFAVKQLGLKWSYVFDLIKMPIYASAAMAIGLLPGIMLFPRIRVFGAFISLAYLFFLVAVGFGLYWKTLSFFSPSFTLQVEEIFKRSLLKKIY